MLFIKNDNMQVRGHWSIEDSFENPKLRIILLRIQGCLGSTLECLGWNYTRISSPVDEYRGRQQVLEIQWLEFTDPALGRSTQAVLCNSGVNSVMEEVFLWHSALQTNKTLNKPIGNLSPMTHSSCKTSEWTPTMNKALIWRAEFTVT